MKDVRHEHPLNDPEHQFSCDRCKQMNTLGGLFSDFLMDLHLNHSIDDESLTTFLLLYIANVALDTAAISSLLEVSEEQLPILREAFLRDAGQAFDVAVRDAREEDEGA